MLDCIDLLVHILMVLIKCNGSLVHYTVYIGSGYSGYYIHVGSV